MRSLQLKVHALPPGYLDYFAQLADADLFHRLLKRPIKPDLVFYRPLAAWPLMRWSGLLFGIGCSLIRTKPRSRVAWGLYKESVRIFNLTAKHDEKTRLLQARLRNLAQLRQSGLPQNGELAKSIGTARASQRRIDAILNELLPDRIGSALTVVDRWGARGGGSWGRLVGQHLRNGSGLALVAALVGAHLAAGI